MKETKKSLIFGEIPLIISSYFLLSKGSSAIEKGLK